MPVVKKPFAYLKTKRAKDGQYYVVLRGKNGEPFMTTETYSNKSNGTRAAKVTFENIAKDYLRSIGYTITAPSDDWKDEDINE